MASGTTTLMGTQGAPRTPASAWALPAGGPSFRERLLKTGARVMGEAFEAHPILCLTSALLFVGAAMAFPLLFLDPRQIGGASVWAGPVRLFLSMAIYCGTILVFGTMMGPSRVFHRVGALISGVAVLALTLTVAQASRGEGAFSQSSPWGYAVGATMGVAFTALWISSIFLTLAMFRQPMGAPGMAWAVRLSMVIAQAGMTLGFLMFSPHGSGPEVGLPFLGWSAEGGDFRPAHFVGLHAIQVLPALAWLLGRRRSLSDAHQVTLVGVASAGYAALMGVLAWQAARAQPVLAPDALTLAALIVVLAGVASAGAAVLSHAATQGAEPIPAHDTPWQPVPTHSLSPVSGFSLARANPLVARPRLADASQAGTDLFDPLPAMGARKRATTAAVVPVPSRLPPPEFQPLRGTVTLRPARASGRVARIRSAKQVALAAAPDQATELDLRPALTLSSSTP
jgi:hypothetical protein